MHAPLEHPFQPQIRLYQNWLRDTRGLEFESYDALWRWSTTDLDAFWQSVWDYFDLQSPTPHRAVLAANRMPGAEWFPGAQFSYARQVFRHVDAAHAAGLPALISHDEASLAAGVAAHELSWPELRRQVASLALHLQAHGVQPGDRVAAYLPNIPEAMIAFLATVSIGAVWSICAPDMGTPAVLDRFKQIAPKVLIACDGVRYGGKWIDRSAVVSALCAALPSVQHVIVNHHVDGITNAIKTIAAYARFDCATARNDHVTAAFEPMWLPFDHPLWIVYSSGTTGLPKPIVHGHGGTVIVALALKVLHNDIGCSYTPNSFGERYHWYSSTGWVMWNAQMSGLLNGTTCCIFDGNPGGKKSQGPSGGPEHPDWTTLWRFAANTGVTFFGAGAAFFANCMKAGVDLTRCGDLSAVRALGTTGSPLSADVQEWGTEQFWQIRQQVKASSSSASAPTVLPEPVERLDAKRLRQAQPKRLGEEQGEASSTQNTLRFLRANGMEDGEPHKAGDHTLPSSIQQGPRGWLRQTAGASFDTSGRTVAPSGLDAAAPDSLERVRTAFRYAASGGVAPCKGSEPHEVGSVGEPIWWCNISGGTDFAGAFIGGNRELPLVAGEMQCRLLGCAVAAWNDAGEAVVDQVGELVCTQPIPSMPLYLWGDQNNARYLSSYFDTYPNVWRHGDWLKITPTGSCIIYGRSDATINRHGLRMGTSELYSAIEALPEVLDSLVIDLEYLGRASYMPLFVVLRGGIVLDDALSARINSAVRSGVSPRFVPDAIFAVPDIPRTLSGKKQELPIKKLLLGQPIEKVVNRDAMANPHCLDWYVRFASEYTAKLSASA